MYVIYGTVLIILLGIASMLWKEEKRLRKNVDHGLASKFWVLREKRKFVRFNEEIKIRYNSLNNHKNSRHSKSFNVSRKGVCLVTYEKLSKKTHLELEMDVPGFSRPVILTGRVMWTKDLHKEDSQGRRLFYTGIRFYKIKPEAEAVLLTHLNKLKES